MKQTDRIIRALLQEAGSQTEFKMIQVYYIWDRQVSVFSSRKAGQS